MRVTWTQASIIDERSQVHLWLGEPLIRVAG